MRQKRRRKESKPHNLELSVIYYPFRELDCYFFPLPCVEYGGTQVRTHAHVLWDLCVYVCVRAHVPQSCAHKKNAHKFFCIPSAREREIMVVRIVKLAVCSSYHHYSFFLPCFLLSFLSFW